MSKDPAKKVAKEKAAPKKQAAFPKKSAGKKGTADTHPQASMPVQLNFGWPWDQSVPRELFVTAFALRRAQAAANGVPDGGPGDDSATAQAEGGWNEITFANPESGAEDLATVVSYCGRSTLDEGACEAGLRDTLVGQHAVPDGYQFVSAAGMRIDRDTLARVKSDPGNVKLYTVAETLYDSSGKVEIRLGAVFGTSREEAIQEWRETEPKLPKGMKVATLNALGYPRDGLDWILQSPALV
jgi:hypothetical protein